MLHDGDFENTSKPPHPIAKIRLFDSEPGRGRMGSYVDMDLHCQHCCERIVSRGTLRYPGCFRDLPDEIQIRPREKHLEKMEVKWKEMEERLKD